MEGVDYFNEGDQIDLVNPSTNKTTTINSKGATYKKNSDTHIPGNVGDRIPDQIYGPRTNGILYNKHFKDLYDERWDNDNPLVQQYWDLFRQGVVDPKTGSPYSRKNKKGLRPQDNSEESEEDEEEEYDEEEEEYDEEEEYEEESELPTLGPLSTPTPIEPISSLFAKTPTENNSPVSPASSVSSGDSNDTNINNYDNRSTTSTSSILADDEMFVINGENDDNTNPVIYYQKKDIKIVQYTLSEGVYSESHSWKNIEEFFKFKTIRNKDIQKIQPDDGNDSSDDSDNSDNSKRQIKMEFSNNRKELLKEKAFSDIRKELLKEKVNIIFKIANEKKLDFHKLLEEFIPEAFENRDIWEKDYPNIRMMQKILKYPNIRMMQKILKYSNSKKQKS